MKKYNSTTGRTFVGLRNFLEENGGKVVGYYALTTGQDQSEKMVTTDKTWNKIVSLGIDAVRDFAEKEGVKREISKRGLTERESQVLVRQFEREKGNTRRGNEDVTRSSRSGRKVYSVSDTEKKTGSTGKGNKVNFSLKKTVEETKNLSAFAIYSTDDYKNPTLLYEAKGKKGELEKDIVVNLLEERKNGTSANGKSAYVNWVSGGGWLQKVNNSKNNLTNLGR